MDSSIIETVEKWIIISSRVWLTAVFRYDNCTADFRLAVPGYAYYYKCEQIFKESCVSGVIINAEPIIQTFSELQTWGVFKEIWNHSQYTKHTKNQKEEEYTTTTISISRYTVSSVYWSLKEETVWWEKVSESRYTITGVCWSLKEETVWPERDQNPGILVQLSPWSWWKNCALRKG